MEPTVKIKFIELSNFKTFRGHNVVGPLKSFTAIIGPNGSGKSNFMDAISFVMGADITSLRTKSWTNLIHGAANGQPVATECSVTVCLSLSNGSIMSFQRSVGSSSDYKINAETVTKHVYFAELKKLRINAMANSFIVSQSLAESIAMSDSKERAALIEKISTSDLLKDDYNRLKREMYLAAKECRKLCQKRKRLLAEQKNTKPVQLEAVSYTQLNNEFAEKQLQFQLFRLFHMQKKIGTQNQVLQSKQKVLQVLNEKKEQKFNNSEVQKMQEDIRLLEMEVCEKHFTFIKTKNLIIDSQLTLNSAIQYLEQARHADNDYSEKFNTLQDEMMAIESRMSSCEDAIREESVKLGVPLDLEDSMFSEYNQLNQRAKAKAVDYIGQQQSTILEQKWDQILLDNEIIMKQNIVNQLESHRLRKDKAKKRMDILSDEANSCRLALKKQNRVIRHLKEEVGLTQERILELQLEWNKVMEQLSDADRAEIEDDGMEKKREVMEMLKQTVPGVYDRLINLCQPTHQQYNVAVTTVLDKYKDTIIVDTAETIHICRKILHERKLEVGTYLPYDALREIPLNESLRSISDPKNVKLVYDVLKFPPEIEKAVRFATNNALVCETPDAAMKVNSDSGYDAVALDGTFYQKSVITYRGGQNLARASKAIRWNDISIEQMQLEINRWKNNRRDYNESARSFEIYDGQCAHYERDLVKTGSKLTELEILIGRHNQVLEELKQQMSMVEDDNFSDFCRRNGVPNIRSYEERVLVHHESVVQKRAVFEWQIDRIKSSMQFETGRNTKANVERCERDVQDKKDALEANKQAENKYRNEIDNGNKRVEKLKKRKAYCIASYKNIDMKIQRVNDQRRLIKSKIETNINERQTLLSQANMNGLRIPTIHGNVNDVLRNVDAICDGNDYSSEENATNNVQFDFSKIPQSLKDLRDRAVKEMSATLAKELEAKKNRLEHVPRTSNTCVDKKLESLNNRITLLKQEYATAIKKSQKSKAAFKRVKNARIKRFNTCYKIISDNIDGIYKALICDESAQAYLGLEHPEEPYLCGVDYTCVVPGKPLLPMLNLGNGEKIVAALALLFAIQCFQPSPFVLLDQIDGLLDNINIGKLDSFIREVKPGLQTIAVSSNEELFARADLLVGLTQVPGNLTESHFFVYDHNNSLLTE